MKIYSIKIVSSFLILMFIISGIGKIITLGKNDSKRLAKKIKINLFYSQILVFLAGLWELGSSILILLGIWKFNTKLLNFGSFSLAIFTILATIIFYISPFKYLPFLSNLTTLCALLLLPYICVKC